MLSSKSSFTSAALISWNIHQKKEKLLCPKVFKYWQRLDFMWKCELRVRLVAFTNVWECDFWKRDTFFNVDHILSLTVWAKIFLPALLSRCAATGTNLSEGLMYFWCRIWILSLPYGNKSIFTPTVFMWKLCRPNAFWSRIWILGLQKCTVPLKSKKF